MLDTIMNHDKSTNSYYYHGTQSLDAAESIIRTGLAMSRDDLSSTAIRELNKDEVILYERGLTGEIGRDAIVIIDVPLDELGKEKNIIQNNNDASINFLPSGLQGLNGKPNYIISPEFIVGYIDKQNKKVIFNPEYYDYARFNVSEQRTR